MAFLDNSGDIILDAVLTDTGRMLLARGDGSFRITKYAFGDDEINYELFSGSHASGSAYYDLDILQTPILEAFTSNTSSMKSKLITLSNNRLSLLPVIKLNTNNGRMPLQAFSTITPTTASDGSYWILADANTAGTDFDPIAGKVNHGYSGTGTNIPANRYKNAGFNPFFRLDQGLNSAQEGTTPLVQGNDLFETQYLVEMDNRFLQLVGPTDTATLAPKSFVDDDNIASYFLAMQGGTSPFINSIGEDADDVLTGRPGSKFEFRLKVTQDIENSTGAANYLFQTFGNAIAHATVSGSGDDHHTIDTMVRVTGFTTGYRVDIPIKIIKKDA